MRDLVEPDHPADLDVLEAAELLARRRLSALELTDACLERIEERNGGPPSFDGTPDAVNAWVRIYPDRAREQARAADRRRAAEGEATPQLCGMASQERRAALTAAWESWFAEHELDLVLEPTLPILPYERGPGYDRGHAGGGGDPMIALSALWVPAFAARA